MTILIWLIKFSLCFIMGYCLAGIVENLTKILYDMHIHKKDKNIVESSLNIINTNSSECILNKIFDKENTKIIYEDVENDSVFKSLSENINGNDISIVFSLSNINTHYNILLFEFGNINNDNISIDSTLLILSSIHFNSLKIIPTVIIDYGNREKTEKYLKQYIKVTDTYIKDIFTVSDYVSKNKRKFSQALNDSIFWINYADKLYKEEIKEKKHQEG